MAKNFEQPGDTLTAAAPADVASGDGVLIGAFFGVAAFSAKSGEDVELNCVGVWRLPKTNAQAWTFGAKIYWDGSKCTTADGSGSNTLIGTAAKVAANPSATGSVRLSI